MVNTTVIGNPNRLSLNVDGCAVRVAKTLASAPERSYKAGLKEGKLETARNLKAMNLTNDQIAAATGLSAAEIEKLK